METTYFLRLSKKNFTIEKLFKVINEVEDSVCGETYKFSTNKVSFRNPVDVTRKVWMFTETLPI
ncbi:hypothetical protein PR048_031300 [Dryococelus australis]|uniref:Uncharacterized protein n=1 Tax=Dryococelus australis TaxID=614101 RepID=A0ABQ9G5L0_9NEOP|nr:hypothetical protein PR048_031300 [Dryococelus australis]